MKTHHLAIASLVSIFAACGGSPPPRGPSASPVSSAAATTPPATPAAAASSAAAASAPAAPAMAMFDLQVKSLRDYVRAFNRHDAKAIAALYAEEAALIERGEQDSSGSEAITANFQTFFDAFPDATTAITRSWHSRDTVLFEYVEGGTNTGTHRVHKPTGKKIGYVGASVLQFRPDGKIRSDMTYSDELTREVQAGWAPGALGKMEVRPVIPVPGASDTWEIHRATAGDDEQQRVAAARKTIYSSFALRSEKDFLAALSDDVVLYPYDDPRDVTGKAQAASLFQSWTKTFSDGVMNATEAWSVDGNVVIQGTFTGKQSGAWGPVKPSSRTFKTSFLDVTRINKDGKIERSWTYANNYELLRYLGYYKDQAIDPAAHDPLGGL